MTIVASVTTIDGKPEPGHQRAVDRAAAGPASAGVHAADERHRQPGFAPAARRRRRRCENCEPIEMSICRARMTSVMPTAATSTALLTTNDGTRADRPR